MKTTAFDFRGSQAVKIPEEFRIDTEYVEIEQRGESLIITPIPRNSGWPEGYIESIMENEVDETFIRHPQGEHREIIW